MGRLSIRGAHVVTPGHDLGVADIRIEGDRIAAVGGDAVPRTAQAEIDAGGLIALPGFIDIHSHGRGGADFCDLTDAAFETIGRGQARRSNHRRMRRARAAAHSFLCRTLRGDPLE